MAVRANAEVNLWLAARDGQRSKVRFLVESGVNINSKSSKGLTPLHIASICNRLEIVRYLVEQGADVNNSCSCGVSPLMSACGQGHTQITEFLLQHGADVNATNSVQETALIYLCRERISSMRRPDHVGCRSYLGHVIPSCNLGEHCQCQCLNLVKLLVAAGANVNHEPGNKPTALHAFAFLRHPEVCKFLLESGADPDHMTDVFPILFTACASLDVVKVLLSYGANVNIRDNRFRKTPLMTAVNHSLDVTKFLLEAGAELNASNLKGYTALTFAVWNYTKKYDVVEYLIKAGAKMDRELILAVLTNNEASLQLLITGGALPKQNWKIADLLSDVMYYYDMRKEQSESILLKHSLLKHLKNPFNEKFTPFNVSLMKNTLCVTRYLVKILFLSPVDVELLNHYMQRPSDVENDGISCDLLPLVTQPWSLFNLSFLAVSFAVGFNEDRKERVSKTGLPSLLQHKFLFQDEDAHLPVKEWGNLHWLCKCHICSTTQITRFPGTTVFCSSIA